MSTLQLDPAEDDADTDAEPVCSIHREEMKEIFDLLDADGSGSIDPKEIRMQMQALGFEADNTTIYQLISDMDSDGSQNLEFQEFVKILTDMKLHSVSYATRDNMQEVFDFLDDLEPEKRDKKIDFSNLHRIAQVLGDDITDPEIEVMIKAADQGKDYLTAEDFYVMMADEAKRMREERDTTTESETTGNSQAMKRWKKAQRNALMSDKVGDVVEEWRQSMGLKTQEKARRWGDESDGEKPHSPGSSREHGDSPDLPEDDWRRGESKDDDDDEEGSESGTSDSESESESSR